MMTLPMGRWRIRRGPQAQGSVPARCFSGTWLRLLVATAERATAKTSRAPSPFFRGSGAESFSATGGRPGRKGGEEEGRLERRVREALMSLVLARTLAVMSACALGLSCHVGMCARTLVCLARHLCLLAMKGLRLLNSARGVASLGA